MNERTNERTRRPTCAKQYTPDSSDRGIQFIWLNQHLLVGINVELFWGFSFFRKPRNTSPEQDLLINIAGEGIVLQSNQGEVARLEFDHVFGLDLFDSGIHHVGISVSGQGFLSATIDAVSVLSHVYIGRLPSWDHTYVHLPKASSMLSKFYNEHFFKR